MKIGKLYKFNNRTSNHFDRMFDPFRKPCVYLGEDIIDRKDNVRIVNYKFLLSDGRVRLTDRGFLYLLSEIEE